MITATFTVLEILSFMISFRLKASGLPVRFCTNETTTNRKDLVRRLKDIGFHIEENEVFPPAPATSLILKQRGLRPHLLVHERKFYKFINMKYV